MVVNPATPDPAALAAFMNELGQSGSEKIIFSSGLFANELTSMFAALRPVLDVEFDDEPPIQQPIPETNVLVDFFAHARQPFEAITASGLLSNPWVMAGLRRDEVRNAAVLGWFLDPRGNHGYGGTILADLLARVSRILPGGFPVQASSGCLVSVEECPDGDRANRVDIQIDDQNFFLIMEVKIDALEQSEQIERYCNIAAARVASGRPWAVAFLTIDGRASKTAGDYGERVAAVSWEQLASSFRQVARDAASVPRFLATSFANHISNL